MTETKLELALQGEIEARDKYIQVLEDSHNLLKEKTTHIKDYKDYIEICHQKINKLMIERDKYRTDFQQVLETLAKKEKEVFNSLVLTTKYENLLLKILAKCEGAEINFQEPQHNTIFTGEGDNIVEREYTFSVGQICCVRNWQIYIAPNYDGIHNDEIKGEPVPYKLSTLMDISSVDELIQEKISEMEG